MQLGIKEPPIASIDIHPATNKFTGNKKDSADGEYALDIQVRIIISVIPSLTPYPTALQMFNLYKLLTLHGPLPTREGQSGWPLIIFLTRQAFKFFPHSNQTQVCQWFLHALVCNQESIAPLQNHHCALIDEFGNECP